MGTIQKESNMAVQNATLAQINATRDAVEKTRHQLQQIVQGSRPQAKLSAAEITAVNTQLTALKTALDIVVAA